ncbi:MAG: hypothetical protein DLM62_01795, partial [Pseudonocardiales bacterium]
PVAVTGSDDHTVRVWDLGTGRPIGEPLTGHTNPVAAVATTVLDGRPVAVTGSWDATVRVWDLDAGVELGHGLTTTSAIYSLAVYGSDGALVVVIAGGTMFARVDLKVGLL